VARRQSHPPPLGVSSSATARVRRIGEKQQARRRRVAPGEEEARNQERREHGPVLRSTSPAWTPTPPGASTSPECLHARNTDATPPSGRPRLHRRPTVSTAALLLSSPLGFLPVLASQVWRRIAAEFLPVCWPLRRSLAAPRRMVLLGRLCP
jgi:hypothetical protein